MVSSLWNEMPPSTFQRLLLARKPQVQDPSIGRLKIHRIVLDQTYLNSTTTNLFHYTRHYQTFQFFTKPTQVHITAAVKHQPFKPDRRCTFLQFSLLYKTKPQHTTLVQEEVSVETTFISSDRPHNASATRENIRVRTSDILHCSIHSYLAFC